MKVITLADYQHLNRNYHDPVKLVLDCTCELEQSIKINTPLQLLATLALLPGNMDISELYIKCNQELFWSGCSSILWGRIQAELIKLQYMMQIRVDYPEHIRKINRRFEY